MLTENRQDVMEIGNVSEITLGPWGKGIEFSDGYRPRLVGN